MRCKECDLMLIKLVNINDTGTLYYDCVFCKKKTRHVKNKFNNVCCMVCEGYVK
jgi:hypothetical protein